MSKPLSNNERQKLANEIVRTGTEVLDSYPQDKLSSIVPTLDLGRDARGITRLHDIVPKTPISIISGRRVGDKRALQLLGVRMTDGEAYAFWEDGTFGRVSKEAFGSGATGKAAIVPISDGELTSLKQEIGTVKNTLAALGHITLRA